ncbi:hypothetical protein THAOC_29724 [Thalassiosira oceanica]|uniref:Uncharacterized protein n=1 Tax=Thalassiosira oceanica TaxID=159749 RepID=K0RBR5_THAOC|nr:hypothetical protein THAOC_29724 [Thalassiosira oceanica]|eukprot:EJK51138.1 hypothetical protein THAOC_29724 [Thalassiosira oceanica]
MRRTEGEAERKLEPKTSYEVADGPRQPGRAARDRRPVALHSFPPSKGAGRPEISEFDSAELLPRHLRAHDHTPTYPRTLPSRPAASAVERESRVVRPAGGKEAPWHSPASKERGGGEI